MKKTSISNVTAGKPDSGLPDQKKPLIIAGPCSAETPEQVMQAAKALALDSRVDYFRAGIWKPRTTPDSFQGAGAEGLQWLQDVRTQTGLKVATEVGSEKHVEEALKAGIDMLWIGARTVSNPFVIQEIAEALKGVDIPVLVKNPLSPDIDLWEGAITRLLRAGVNQLGAIHRGFFWLGKSNLRNQPLWHIPLELKRRMPHIPVISDPSHIAGRRSLVPMLANRAISHNFSGLMIEVHPDPENAWSDAAQQLTPDRFFQLMDELFGEQPSPVTSGELLEELRAEVDTMDEMLIWALASRMELSGKIAQVKKQAGLNALQAARWQKVVERVKTMAAASDLDTGFIEKIYDNIHQESLGLQNSVLTENGSVTKKEHNFAI
jgi:chorismate mutase